MNEEQHLTALNQERLKTKVSSNPGKTTKAKLWTRPEVKLMAVELLVLGLLAVINDGCDWIGADLATFRLIDLGTGCLLGLFCLFRLHRFPTKRYLGTFGIELIPLVGDAIPTWTIFIITLALQQTKLGKALPLIKRLK